MYEFKSGRIKPKTEPTFGKKPYKGSNKNRKGNKKTTPQAKRNPLVLPKFYEYMRDKANAVGADAHHYIALSKLKQDIFLAIVPFEEHRKIHSSGDYASPAQWVEEKGLDVLVTESMRHFKEWSSRECLADEYFELIEDLLAYPNDSHNIARDFILNNRSL